MAGKRSDKQLGRQAMDERQRESERRGRGDKACVTGKGSERHGNRQAEGSGRHIGSGCGTCVGSTCVTYIFLRWGGGGG